MDKIKLTPADVEMLDEWNLTHKEEIRTLPCPVNPVEVSVSDIMRITAFREDNVVTFNMFMGNKKVGKKVFTVEPLWGCLRLVKDTTKLPPAISRGMVGLYCELMAFMVYEKKSVETKHRLPPSHRTGSPSRHKSHVTYILRRVSSRRGTGHHASPSHAFMVRGHYRHYKSGKTVWVAPFKKGEGEVKDKNYRI